MMNSEELSDLYCLEAKYIQVDHQLTFVNN